MDLDQAWTAERAAALREELRRSNARVASMRDSLPMVAAESSQEAAQGIAEDLDALDREAGILAALLVFPGRWSRRAV